MNSDLNVDESIATTPVDYENTASEVPSDVLTGKSPQKDSVPH